MKAETKTKNPSLVPTVPISASPALNTDHYERLARFITAFDVFAYMTELYIGGDIMGDADKFYCLRAILNDEAKAVLAVVEADYYPRQSRGGVE